MRQVVQSYRTGEVKLREVPVPRCASGQVLVRTRRSLVSLGTERATIELGRKSLLGKAAARPDLVRRAMDKARKEGLLKTWQEALGRLDTPTPLGYSCAGVVEEAGLAATAFAPGDRVACVGQGFASHAELVAIPVNLAAHVPDTVSDDAAAFGMLGTIALHGVRTAGLTPGSCAAVLGLGLLGQLTVQILEAYGVEVVGYDPAPDKVELARATAARLGGAVDATADAGEVERLVLARTGGHGADAVIITAASTGPDAVDQAVALSRHRGRVVLVGTADVHPDRNEMWRKEVELVVSRAGGAGSLDPLYEVEGVDLPVGEVRWTLGRNLREFLRLLARGKVDVAPLITHRFAIAEAESAYARLMAGELDAPLGVLLEYDDDAPVRRRLPVAGTVRTVGDAGTAAASGAPDGPVNVGVLGAGLFGKALLLPALAKVEGADLHTLVTASGANVEHVARRFAFRFQATDPAEVWSDPEIHAVVGLTPHSQHAALVRQALAHGKPLFLEKPLCVTTGELEELRAAAEAAPRVPPILVGHNRRFSPHAEWIRGLVGGRTGPLVAHLRVNAGFVPADHWVHAEAEGRSRVVGEMSHFVDLLQFLVGAPLVRVHGERVSAPGGTAVPNDNLAATMRFADGSVASLTYTAQGNKGFSREALELHFDGRSVSSRDFRVSEGHGFGRRAVFKTRGQEMGYAQELRHFVAWVQGREEPRATLDDAFAAMEGVFALERSLAEGRPVTLG